jgi:hypothetical protein
MNTLRWHPAALKAGFDVVYMYAFLRFSRGIDFVASWTAMLLF